MTIRDFVALRAENDVLREELQSCERALRDLRAQVRRRDSGRIAQALQDAVLLLASPWPLWLRRAWLALGVVGLLWVAIRAALWFVALATGLWGALT